MAKQKDGRHRNKITIGTKADGRPIYKWASGQTKKELAENLNELRRTYIGGTVIQRDVLFGIFAIDWYEANKKQSSSPGTRSMYRSLLNSHILPQFAERQIRAITANDLQKFINSKKSLAASSISKLRMTLCQIFRSAKAQQIIDADPTIYLQMPSAGKGERRELTCAEQKAVLSIGRSHPDGLLLMVLYFTGLRRGEALGLQWGDINFAEKSLTVHRDLDFITGDIGPLKTKSAYRTIPLPDELLDAMHLCRGLPNVFVFQSRSGDQLQQSTYQRLWRRLMSAVFQFDSSIEHRHTKLQNGKIRRKNVNAVEQMICVSILTPHYFRHNYASLLYEAGIDVISAKEWLGHSDVVTTLRIYTHLSDRKKKVNADRLRDVFRNTQ
jgi:integrase